MRDRPAEINLDLDGPNGGDWISPNWQLQSREAVLYADLTCSDTGDLDGSDPHSWGVTKIDFGFRSIPLRVAEALSRLIADIWGAVAFTEFEDWKTAEGLIRATVEGLQAQHLITEAAVSKDVETLYRLWQWPMYDFDFKPIKIPLAALKDEQEAQFYANL